MNKPTETGKKKKTRFSRKHQAMLPSSDTDAYTPSPVRILLIDADRKYARQFAELLKCEGPDYCEIYPVKSFNEALSLLEQSEVEAVLLSMNLPDNDPLATVASLTAYLPSAPVIAITDGGNEEVDSVLALREGAEDALSKRNLVPSLLWRSIRNAIERKRLQVSLRNSHERFELITRGSNDGLWDWSMDTRQVYFSPRWKEMYGCAEDEVGTDFKEWELRIHPEDLEHVLLAVQAYLEGESPQLHVEHRMRHADGTYRWILARGIALRYPDGRPYRLAGTHVDITNLKQHQGALREATDNLAESEKRFRQIAEHIDKVFWITNANGTQYLYVSPAYEDIYGYRSTELYERPESRFDMILEEDRERVRHAFAEQLASGELDEEYRVMRSDQSITWIRVRAFPVEDVTGRVYRVVGMDEDITERKRAREALQEAHQALEDENKRLKETQQQLIQAEKMNSIGRLAAGIAHELKNPLATISMAVQYLEKNRGNGAASVEPVLDEMNEAVERADRIARGLLEYSSPMKMEMTDTDLNALVHKALLLARYELSNAHVQVNSDLEDSLPLLSLDTNKMMQALLNLIINAVHAMRDGGGHLTIRTRCAPVQILEDSANGTAAAPEAMDSARFVTLEVDDTGPGIPEKTQQRMFDPFYTTKPAGEGSGLGLAVAKSIVDLHGASIDIVNRPDGGARASIRFLI